MGNSKIKHLAWVVGLSVVFSLALQPVWPETQKPDTQEETARTASGASQLPLNELRIFAEVFEKIKRDYVEDVDDKTLLTNAIKGMLYELDPHSAYLEKDAFEDLKISTMGEFGGLGIEVEMENGFVKVISPIDDTPAKAAGIRAGDVIVKLDDAHVKGISLAEAIELMRGKPGTQIELTIVREGVSQPFKVSVTRDVIQVKSVRGRMLEPGYGYIRISQFQNQTGADVERVIKKLKKEAAAAELKGIILDLRNNPGGVLRAAIEVSDAFIDSGLIVYTKGRVDSARSEANATAGDMLSGAPVVVLVNGGSASASEIVAGALQDHQRALIMGTTTFGKGSVQTVIPLYNDQGLKLTTARYYTPSGRSIQATGIQPDITVEAAELRLREGGDLVKEANLPGHLVNNLEANDGMMDHDDDYELVTEDYQLYEALNMLKSYSILKARDQVPVSQSAAGSDEQVLN